LVILFIFPSFVRFFAYMMTHNCNDIIAPTVQAATPVITFPSLCEATLSFPPSPFLVLYRVVVGVAVFVGIVVVTVMFKSLYLVEMYSLMGAF